MATARASPRACLAGRTTRSGSRPTPRRARSTGPTSTPARSGSGPWGAAPWPPHKTLFNSSTPSGPAVDPTTNKIYWTSWTSGLGIRVGNRDGTGTVSTLFGGEGASLFAALVKAPVNTVRPAISGGAKVGEELTCQNGTWAPDLLASFLFRAPASFAYQWKLNGGNIATGPTFTPNLAGDYTCTVTATNQAGDTVQTSAVKKVKAK